MGGPYRLQRTGYKVRQGNGRSPDRPRGPCLQGQARFEARSRHFCIHHTILMYSSTVSRVYYSLQLEHGPAQHSATCNRMLSRPGLSFATVGMSGKVFTSSLLSIQHPSRLQASLLFNLQTHCCYPSSLLSSTSLPISVPTVAMALGLGLSLLREHAHPVWSLALFLSIPSCGKENKTAAALARCSSPPTPPLPLQV